MKSAAARPIAFFFLICACLSRAEALELRNGLLRILIDERDGSFSAYILVDAAKARYEPFWSVKDPRTSFALLQLGERNRRLGRDLSFRVKVSRTDTGFETEFRSPLCRVLRIVDFAFSRGSSEADGLQIRYVLENSSAKAAPMGLRLIVDTNLGEKTKSHFITALRADIRRETELLHDEAWIESKGPKGDFMLQVAGLGLDRPDRVVMGNWQRLVNAAGVLEPDPDNAFSLLPYSVNDSAVAMYWEPRMTPKDGSRSFSFFVGAMNPEGYTEMPPTESSSLPQAPIVQIQPPIAARPALPQASTPLASMPREAAAPSAEYLAAMAILEKIDAALAAGVLISEEDITQWQRALELLEVKEQGK